MSRTELWAQAAVYLEIYLTLFPWPIRRPNWQACGLLERRAAAGLVEDAAEPAGAHEDQHTAADDDPANAASVAARLRVVRI
eukprot:scaffold99559_cov65-Phaeocystis_antarctica.AAC.5